VEEASGAGKELIESFLPRFLERRHWAGVVQIRLKNQNSVCYFDCVAHAMLRDDQVHGVTILARDITASRRNEARFTELFETLQEGIYIVTPNDRILDANPALVRMLGYGSKEDLHGAPEVTFKQQNEILERSISLAKQFKTGKVRCFDFWRLEDVAPHRAAIDDKLRSAGDCRQARHPTGSRE